MDTEKLSHWVQIVSGIALVAGLALVLIEMRQTKQLVRTQLIAESEALGLSRNLTLLGENPARALAKTCDSDSEMSREEALVLNHLYYSHLYTVFRAYEVDTRGGFEDEYWKAIGEARLREIFATPHGRAWWIAGTKSLRATPIIKFGNQLLNELGPPTCHPTVDAILDSHKSR